MKITTKPTFDEEKKLWEKGYCVIGIDEVGRGAFAGPLVVGAVIFSKVSREQLNCRHSGKQRLLQNQQGMNPEQVENLGINDSKLLKPLARRRLARQILENCLCSAVVSIPVSKINKVGIGKTNQMAFRKVISKTIKSLCQNEILKPIRQAQGPEYIEGQVQNDSGKKYFVLVDGFHVKYLREIGLKNQKAIIKGDQKSISISAASIIAKVHRDKLMKGLSQKYPQYMFGKNKGYGTNEHQEAIKKYGLCKIHRKSFNLKKFCSQY